MVVNFSDELLVVVVAGKVTLYVGLVNSQQRVGSVHHRHVVADGHPQVRVRWYTVPRT